MGLWGSLRLFILRALLYLEQKTSVERRASHSRLFCRVTILALHATGAEKGAWPFPSLSLFMLPNHSLLHNTMNERLYDCLLSRGLALLLVIPSLHPLLSLCCYCSRHVHYYYYHRSGWVIRFILYCCDYTTNNNNNNNSSNADVTIAVCVREWVSLSAFVSSHSCIILNWQIPASVECHFTVIISVISGFGGARGGGGRYAVWRQCYATLVLHNISEGGVELCVGSFIAWNVYYSGAKHSCQTLKW